MRPLRFVLWVGGLVALATGADRAEAAWNNVFQVCCLGCKSHPPATSNYYAAYPAYAGTTAAYQYYKVKLALEGRVWDEWDGKTNTTLVVPGGPDFSNLDKINGVYGEVKGKEAPDFVLHDLEGKQVKLSDFRGKAVLLNFWATWCGPCRVEMPWFVEMQKQYGPQGLEIIGVALDDSGKEAIQKFAKEMGVNYLILQGHDAVGDVVCSLQWRGGDLLHFRCCIYSVFGEHSGCRNCGHARGGSGGRR